MLSFAALQRSSPPAYPALQLFYQVKVSLSYGQMLLAHAHYARSSAPAYPALHFKPFRFSNVSAASGRQRCFASCVSVDFLRLQSSTFKCWYLWGLDRWCRLVGVTPCRTGTVLFCRQGVGGFGTDPQMTAVPSMASFVCFHLKWARVVIALFTLACLHSLTLSVLAAYELCRLHEVSSSIGARMAR